MRRGAVRADVGPTVNGRRNELRRQPRVERQWVGRHRRRSSLPALPTIGGRWRGLAPQRCARSRRPSPHEQRGSRAPAFPAQPAPPPFLPRPPRRPPLAARHPVLASSRPRATSPHPPALGSDGVKPGLLLRRSQGTRQRAPPAPHRRASSAHRPPPPMALKQRHQSAGRVTRLGLSLGRRRS